MALPSGNFFRQQGSLHGTAFGWLIGAADAIIGPGPERLPQRESIVNACPGACRYKCEPGAAVTSKLLRRVFFGGGT